MSLTDCLWLLSVFEICLQLTEKIVVTDDDEIGEARSGEVQSVRKAMGAGSAGI